MNTQNQLIEHLSELKLPTMKKLYEPLARQAESNSFTFEQYLLELVQKECETRRNNTIERYLRQSQLPLEKSLENFDLKRLPLKLRQQFNALCDGSFVARKENVSAFGNPGTGKTHLLCALCHELIRRGQRVMFSKAPLLVQQLLKAKQELKLARVIKALSKFEVLFIDDIGYVKHDRDEIEVLFTLLAERYERGSVLITSNLPFSKWERIFKDPMTTAAAIDRLVHYCVVLELNLDSYRVEQAKRKTRSADQAA